jgi:hypothetical protein
MVESLDKSRKIHTRLYTSSVVHESEENLLVTPMNVSNQKKKNSLPWLQNFFFLGGGN